MPHYTEILSCVFSSNKSILLHNLCRALKIGQLTLLHHYHLILSVIVQSPSLVPLFANPWTAAHQAPLSFTVSQSLLKVMSIEWVMSPNHLILCHPLFVLPLIFPSIKVVANESVLDTQLLATIDLFPIVIILLLEK